MPSSFPTQGVVHLLEVLLVGVINVPPLLIFLRNKEERVVPVTTP